METIMTVVRAVRSLRAELAIPPAQAIPLYLRAEPAERQLLEEMKPYIAALAKADPITIAAPDSLRPSQSVAAVLSKIELLIPLGGLIDAAKERDRLMRSLRELNGDLERLRAKLANPEFLERAPADVVAREHARTQELQTRRARVEELLEVLATG